MENNKYSGMTVNERLYVSGLMGNYDRAVQIGDVQKIKEILTAVAIDEESIFAILKSLKLIKANS